MLRGVARPPLGIIPLVLDVWAFLHLGLLLIVLLGTFVHKCLLGDLRLACLCLSCACPLSAPQWCATRGRLCTPVLVSIGAHGLAFGRGPVSPLLPGLYLGPNT